MVATTDAAAEAAAAEESAAARARTTATPTPTVTVFTSIDGIADQLRESSNSSKSNNKSNGSGGQLKLVEIRDDALTGFGGTVNFVDDPSQLSSSTLERLREAEILITEPAVLAPLLKLEQQQQQSPPQSLLLPNLKWVQSTYAGIDPLLKLDCSQFNFTLTRFAGKFGPPMAEWCLARMIEHERDFAATAADQKEHEWAGRREQVTRYRYLSDLTLTILGCGDIGCCIARAAKAFGMRVVGYVRTAKAADDEEQRGGGGVDVFTTDLAEALEAADYIISVLPSTDETVGMLSGDALSPAQSKSPVFLNVGRGSVISEASLIAALDQKYISAAILDVFETEPLPPNSPLWDRPDVVVSPHVSALTRGEDVPDLFLQNYQRYCQGQALLYEVNWSQGY